jgi:spore coat protein CotF
MQSVLLSTSIEFEHCARLLRSIDMKPTSLNRLTLRTISGSLMMSAALLITSTSVYAQASSDPGTHQVTRAEVQHELQELEAAGYNPSQGDDGDYPADIQEAERKVAAMHAAQKSALMNAQPAMQVAPTN